MKTVLVTGASSGIGADAARELGQRGWRVILTARSEPALKSIAAEIGEHALAASCDVSDGEAVLSLAERLRSELGVPDAVVNCAGMGEWKWIEDTLPGEALDMIKAPYLGAFNMSHAFMRGMLDRGSGVLVHINSPACFTPWPSSLGYSASRWALRGLHESLCQDLPGTGVQSCHVVFGKVDSPYFEHNDGADNKLPGITKLVRTLSTKEAGRLVADVVEKPRRQVIHPMLLRMFYWNHQVFPWMTRFLLRVTGVKRSLK